MRPLLSVTVTLSMTGTEISRWASTSSTATMAALAFSVSKMVSIEQEIDAAVQQPSHLLRVGVANVVERHRAIRRLVDARRDAQRPVGRADGAGDEPRLVRRAIARALCSAFGEACGFHVEVVYDVLELVVRLRYGLRAEGVGLDDVGAGREVGVVDGLDDVGAREHDDVVVPGELTTVARETLTAEVRFREAVVLDRGPHGPVEHQDALSGELLDGGTGLGVSHFGSFVLASSRFRSRSGAAHRP